MAWLTNVKIQKCFLTSRKNALPHPTEQREQQGETVSLVGGEMHAHNLQA